MSDRQFRTTTPGSIIKRTRKSSIKTSNDDEKQRERKRALDRKAQRASREKTRSHIAHLENMVRILSENNGSSSTGELMDEMTRLHAEIDRLRKIIDSIKSVLGVEVLETVAPRQPSQTPEHASSSGSSRLHEAHNLCEINSPCGNSPVFHQVHIDDGSSWDIGHTDPNLDAHGELEVRPDNHMLENTHTPSVREVPLSNHIIRRTNLDFMDSIEGAQSPQSVVAVVGGTGSMQVQVDNAQSALQSRWEDIRRVKFPNQQLWDLPSPRKTVALLEAPVPDYIPCKIWQKANNIYAKIFEFDRQRSYASNNVHAGSIIKIVKDGWDVLTFQEKTSPILQILKEVDENLFWDLDPVTKVANLYKSLLLLKYYFESEDRNLERMPPWQRPVHSQKIRRHPVPIDFFPWPALRERFIRHHNYYFSTPEFAVNYRRQFKFAWPFSFAETYTTNPATGEYELTPLFQRYHRDMRCWSMERGFFDRFPELKGEMSVHEAGAEALVLTDVEGIQNFGFPVQEAIVHGQSYTDRVGGFDVMELFDECPPT